MARRPAAEILQDDSFHRRQWRIQRAGWGLGALLLALALAGLFGDGPLSHAEAANPAMSVEYERFIRRDGPAEIDLNIRAAGANEVRVAVSRAYLLALRVESILPYPASTQAVGDEVVFVFRVAPQTDSARVTLNVTPLHAGGLRGAVRLPQQPLSEALRIDQFVWP